MKKKVQALNLHLHVWGEPACVLDQYLKVQTANNVGPVQLKGQARQRKKESKKEKKSQLNFPKLVIR